MLNFLPIVIALQLEAELNKNKAGKKTTDSSTNMRENLGWSLLCTSLYTSGDGDGLHTCAGYLECPLLTANPFQLCRREASSQF